MSCSNSSAASIFISSTYLVKVEVFEDHILCQSVLEMLQCLLIAASMDVIRMSLQGNICVGIENMRCSKISDEALRFENLCLPLYPCCRWLFLCP